MTLFLAAMNLILGIAYTGYGILTALDMRRGWSTRGFSHFGAAWILMAFTCGPHHLTHALHLAFENRPAGALDVVAVAVGLPAGIIWLLLRIEAFAGGRGDRHVSGTPAWGRALPFVAVFYLVMMVVGGVTVIAGTEQPRFATTIVPNLMLLWIYMAIGFFLLRTQLRNREPNSGWSVSGVSLTVVFPTCALMHTAWVVYSIAGVYHFDPHGFVIDWLSVPAGLYFLWVVAGLYRGTISDWNQPAHVVVAQPQALVAS